MKRILLALVFVCALSLSAYAQEKTQPAKDPVKKDVSTKADPEQLPLDDKQFQRFLVAHNAVVSANAARDQALLSVVNVDLEDIPKVIAVTGKLQVTNKEVGRAELEKQQVLAAIQKEKNCENCALSDNGKFLLKPAAEQPANK